MRIVIFGMGYVGLVSAACLTHDGHIVTGIDISQVKIDLINAGTSPIVESSVAEKLRVAIDSGRLSATQDPSASLGKADLAIVCVGTPTHSSEGVDITAVEAVVHQIASAARMLNREIPTVIRSTVPVGTMELQFVPIWHKYFPGSTPPLLFHPEFLREGSAVADYYDPPRIVIGEAQLNCGAGNRLMELYENFDAPIFRIGYREAEILKYCDNVFHALKIVFANEVGLLARAYKVDSRHLMEIFTADTKLNISPKYLRPGFAFGGSCLPKDLRGFLVMAKNTGIDLPLISSISRSNSELIVRATEEILYIGAARIGLYGLSFKANTDDLRESPLVILAEQLLGKGKKIVIVDRSVDDAKLVGGNQAFVNQHLPHLGDLVSADLSALDACELIVLGHQPKLEQIYAWLDAGKLVYDLAGTRTRPVHSGYSSLT